MKSEIYRTFTGNGPHSKTSGILTPEMKANVRYVLSAVPVERWDTQPERHYEWFDTKQEDTINDFAERNGSNSLIERHPA